MQGAPSTARSGPPETIRSIGPEPLFQWLASGRRVLVVDVREPAEVERSHARFPGALQIPIHQLFVRRAELPLGKVDSVVTVSNTGVRSRAAAFTLSLLGFREVYSLEGGVEGWARKRLPLA